MSLAPKPNTAVAGSIELKADNPMTGPMGVVERPRHRMGLQGSGTIYGFMVAKGCFIDISRLKPGIVKLKAQNNHTPGLGQGDHIIFFSLGGTPFLGKRNAKSMNGIFFFL